MVLVARDSVQRHPQDQGRKAGDQAEHDGNAHVRCVLGDAHELRGGPLHAGRAVEQDHFGDADRDVEEVREAGDSCVRRASHVLP